MSENVNIEYEATVSAKKTFEYIQTCENSQK